MAVAIDNCRLSMATAKLAEPGFLEVERQRGRAAAQVISRASRAHGKLRPRSTRALTQSVRRCHAQERAWNNAAARFGRESWTIEAFHDWAKTRADAVASVTRATVC